MMEVTPTKTPAVVATTTPAAGMASTIGKVCAVKMVSGKFNFSGKSGSQASGGQRYSTSYNYNQGTSSTKYK